MSQQHQQNHRLHYSSGEYDHTRFWSTQDTDNISRTVSIRHKIHTNTPTVWKPIAYNNQAMNTSYALTKRLIQYISRQHDHQHRKIDYIFRSVNTRHTIHMNTPIIWKSKTYNNQTIHTSPVLTNRLTQYNSRQRPHHHKTKKTLTERVTQVTQYIWAHRLSEDQKPTLTKRCTHHLP